MTKLTENQTAVISYILGATRSGQYIQDGEFGVWFDSLAKEAASGGFIKDVKQAKVTLNQMIKKNLFKVDTTIEEGSSWLELTDAGKEALTQVLLPEEDAEELVGDIRADVEPGTPEDEVEDAIAELEEEAAPAEADEDLIGEVTTTQTETGGTVREWTDADDVEWTEIHFSDGSRAIKRRKKVSGSWRTDYWGAEFEGDKETYTSAKRFKMAKAYGFFTHTDKES